MKLINTETNKKCVNNGNSTKNGRRKKSLCYKIVLSIIVFAGVLYIVDFSFLNISLSSQIDYYSRIIKRKHQNIIREYFPSYNGHVDSEEDQSNYDPNDYFVKTVGCKMAKFPVTSKDTKKYFTPKKNIPKLKCGPPALSKSDEKYLWINMDQNFLAKHYNITNPSSLKCQYREFTRLTEDTVIYSNISINFPNDQKIPISTEFIKVTCSYDNYEIYLNFHSFVIEKPFVEKRIRKLNKLNRKTVNRDSNKYNVMILGIDSVSKINFYRLMKKSYATLQKLDAFEYFGFSKVADNTFPNLVPVMTGLTAEELSDACAPNTTFDKCRFIWHDFTHHRSMFAEDSSWLGLFNYFQKGFKNQPTDYYWRSFITELESVAYNKQGNYKMCMVDKRPIDYLFDYIKKFMKTMNEKDFWSFFWSSSMTHDYVSYPALIDDDLNDLLLEFNRTYSKNTILILMSDHGIRFGEFRNTYQGMIEERHPFLYILFPKSFIDDEHPIVIENLKRNRRRLTSHFDLYATMKDLSQIASGSLSYNSIQMRNQYLSEGNLLPRGISLFLNIPSHRNCDSAAISSHYCTCFDRYEVSTNDLRVQKSARFLLQSINIMLEKHKQCQKLYLNSIVSAYIDILSNKLIDPTKQKSSLDLKSNNINIPNNKFITNSINSYDIYVKVTTKPGKGEFEATIRYFPEIDNMKLTAPVSRTNLYGKNSYCVKDSILKLYCYCDH